MNITGIGSNSWYTSQRSQTQREGQDGASGSLAAAGLQGGGPPPLTDDMAADFGSRLQQEDADLFAQVDSDGNGTLSASEMESGKDLIHQAMAATAGSRPPPPPPEGGQSSDGTSDEQLQELLQALKDQGWSDVQVNQLREVLSQVLGTGLGGASTSGAGAV